MKILLLALLAISCGKEQSIEIIKSSVINGSKVESGDDGVAFTAGIISKLGSICSGVLIHPRVVLTAGHCVNGMADDHRIFLGGKAVFDLHDPSALKVSRIITHPDYTTLNGIYADVALMELAEDAAAEFRPIKILSDMAFDNHMPVLSFGYSPYIDSNSDYYDYLDNNVVPLIKKNNGREFYMFGKLLSVKQLEFPMPHDVDKIDLLQPSGGVCMGDSGGPTIIKDGNEFVLLGTTSTVPSYNDKELNANCHNRAWLTSTAYHLKWVKQAVELLGHSVKLKSFQKNPPKIPSNDRKCLEHQEEFRDEIKRISNMFWKARSCRVAKRNKDDFEELITYSKSVCSTKFSSSYISYLEKTHKHLQEICP